MHHYNAYVTKPLLEVPKRGTFQSFLLSKGHFKSFTLFKVGSVYNNSRAKQKFG